jgi:3-oxoadipate enol-lactonase
MWDDQAAVLSKDFQVLRYNCRGQRGSSLGEVPYSVAQLGGDVLAILNALGIERAHWCGVSLGGMVGQWLGANAARRFDRIILANTTCYYPNPSFWLERIEAVRGVGLAAIADRVIGGWLTAGFRERMPVVAQRMKEMLLATPTEGYIETCRALSRLDQRSLLPTITRPTLVIAGRDDASTPVQDAEFIVSQIPGARITVLDAAHISNVEQSEAFTNEISGFLRR